MKKVLQHVDKNMNVLVKDLRILIQQPSGSAKNQGIKKCANLVRNTLKKSGIRNLTSKAGNQGTVTINEKTYVYVDIIYIYIYMCVCVFSLFFIVFLFCVFVCIFARRFVFF